MDRMTIIQIGLDPCFRCVTFPEACRLFLGALQNVWRFPSPVTDYFRVFTLTQNFQIRKCGFAGMRWVLFEVLC